MGEAVAVGRVSPERLERNFNTIAAIGALPGGGCERLAFSPEERAAHAEFHRMAEAAGLTVRVDEIGNSFARLEPTNGRPRAQGDVSGAANSTQPDSPRQAAHKRTDIALEPAILTGSHLDTVAKGGCFDGAAGVICSLEAVIALAEARASGEIDLKRPVEVVAWANEEGARFAPAMMGSAVFAGAMSLEAALASRDRDGISVAEAKERSEAAQGSSSGSGGREQIGKDISVPPAAYVELHIEQGVELEEARLPVAIVEGVQAQIAGDWTITGRSAHAGATPMHRRSDALVASASLISRTTAIAAEHAPGVGTVGSLTVTPGSRNSVPGEVAATVDLRHPEESSVDSMRQAFLEAGEQVAEKERCAFSFTERWRAPRVAFDGWLVELLETSAAKAGVRTMRLFSAAGHDAVHIAPLAPTAMIFVPSVEGLSHHPQEKTPMEALFKGAQLLAVALSDIASHSHPAR